MRTTFIVVLMIFASALAQSQLLPPHGLKHRPRGEEEQDINATAFRTPLRANIHPLKTTAVIAFTPIKVNQDTTTEPQNECTVAINPLNKDNAVFVFRDFRYGSGENETVPIRNVGIATTTDGGVTWSETLAAYGNHNRFSDPNVAVDKNGTFFVVTLDGYAPPTEAITDTLDFTVRQSSDGGLTWFNEVATDPDGDHDKEMIAVDASPVSPYVGNVYVAGDVSPDYGHTPLSADLFAATPIVLEGDIFSGPVPVAGYFPDLAAGINGEMYIVYTSDDSGLTLLVKSTDGGASFGPPVNVRLRFAPRTQSLTIRHSIPFQLASRFALTAVTRRTAATSMSRRRRFGWRCRRVLRKIDERRSDWLPPVRVNNDSLGNGKDQSHIAMTVDDSGYVDLHFPDRRNDPHIFCDAYFAQLATAERASRISASHRRTLIRPSSTTTVAYAWGNT